MMFALLISLAFSAVLVSTSLVLHLDSGTTIFSGIFGFILLQVLIGFLVRKKVTAIQKELQGILQSGQQRINRKVQQFQMKPGGNPKLIQRQIENDQKEIVLGALQFTTRLEPFKKWALMMGRQIATMRLQFLYQLKEFEQVDEIFSSAKWYSGPMMMEPMPVAMKMARQYKNSDIDGAEKTFKQHIKWFRGNRGSLLYALMAWIFMKKSESDKARLLLHKAKESTSNEILARNWELLSNNKDKSFSNAGFGDEWYSLYLENPPTPKPQRMRGNAQSGRRF